VRAMPPGSYSGAQGGAGAADLQRLSALREAASQEVCLICRRDTCQILQGVSRVAKLEYPGVD
jgi:hypothetical protein